MLEAIKDRKSTGPSLTVKWAFASSVFIFIVFTIFAVVTYKTSVDLLTTNERKKMERIVQKVEERLSIQDSDLTIITTISELQREDEAEGDRDEGQKNNAGTLLSEITAEGVVLNVYSPDKFLVYSSDGKEINLIQKESDGLKTVGLGQETGYLKTQEIHSALNGKLIGYIQIFYKLDEFYLLRTELLIVLLILECLSMLISSVLGFFLANYFLNPIKILKNTMEIIKDDPKSEMKMEELNTNDELEDLAKIFNEMILQMRAYIESQEQFVSDVSHELRTPVAIVEGHLSMLARWGKDDPEVLAKGIDASLQEISRMKNLVQEMLELSRAEVMDDSFLSKTTWAKEVVQRTVENFRLLHADFEIIFEDQLPKDKIVKFYKYHFEQLMIIMIDNAIKYSKDDHRIIVSVALAGSGESERVKISIQDFGEGMSQEDAGKIFNRFYRVDKARARTKGGNGLGLSIAKKFITNYKGTITVDTELDKGTTFTIYLPLALNQFETID
ncbi:MAG: HAMP domain-containing histidine kinase [Streptococcaceae bacterium]|jgi:signal transduction histidine kinase|nr:HAMP domain-containing histidine kinase [Streptococcaceae bacterium]